MSRTRVVLTLVIVAVISAACGSGADTTASSVPTTAADRVTIDTFMFDPTPLTVPVGTTVTWTNGDAIDHTVTSGRPDHADGSFMGTLDGKGTTFALTFEHAGTFAYFCEIHPVMKGSVTVT